MKRFLSLTVSGLILTAVAAMPGFAYEIGDTINEDVKKQLNIPAGKVGIIDFFASWCVSCAKEIPDIHKFIEQDSQAKTQVIGIDVDEELEEGLAFQKQLKISFPVVNDTHQKLIEAFGPIGMPALYYIIDNKIVGKRIGAIDHIDKKITEDLKKLGVNL